MLITILVGLDGIVPYQVEANDEFHTSWNPKCKEISVQRSKAFAKKALLAWLVDCLDMYLRLINQAPILIPESDLKFKIDSPDISRSVYKRINLVCSYYEISSINYALVDLLICWRNRLTHFQAENNISESNREVLISNATEILDKHCGLNITSTLKSFDKCGFPTFKEVSSFVRASINLVSEMDEQLIYNIGMVRYADRVIIKYLSEDKENRLNNIFSKDLQTAEKSLKQILYQNGFIARNENDVDRFCTEISALNYREAKSRLELGTFTNIQ